MLKVMEKEIDLAASPILLEDDFSNPSLSENWDLEHSTGEWWVEDGWLTGLHRGNSGGLLYSKKGYPGNVLLDFEARAVPPCDNAFYQHLGRKRDYPLTGFLSALILQKIFTIPTDSLLILLLNLCKELRDFCGFSKVSDAPLFTRFKLGFADHIELIFQQMVDYTEPICQQIDSSLAQILTFDTSGIELYVTENNPKTLNALIRKLKTYYKDNPDIAPL